MGSTRRMIYKLLMPDIAVGPGPSPLGSIEGRGVEIPAVDCPMPRNGNRSPLSVCMDCNKCGGIEVHSVLCDYVATAQDMAEMQRRMGQQGPSPPAPQPQQAQPHPGIQPPVPPNVFNPQK